MAYGKWCKGNLRIPIKIHSINTTLATDLSLSLCKIFHVNLIFQIVKLRN